MSDTIISTATFGNGCFWCTEAIFQQLNGVIKVTSGYSGGQIAEPTSRKFAMATPAMQNGRILNMMLLK